MKKSLGIFAKKNEIKNQSIQHLEAFRSQLERYIQVIIHSK